MRATVLKAVPGEVNAIVLYYDGLERPPLARGGAVGYYDDPEEPPGRWWGSGCAAVALAGEVKPEQLEHMLDAQHPLSGRKLGRGYGVKSARAYDATFSAPKSVSLLWALSPDGQVRAEVLAAHDTAVETALGWLEKHGNLTRRGTDGVDQVDACGLTVALFRQHTSRALDPQLHTHAVVWAKVQDPTGKWLALDARFLLRQQRSIGWVYDAALRVELSRRLGVDWQPLEPGVGQSDLAGVPAGLREVFSQRRAQVADKLAELIDRWSVEHDGADPDARTLYVLERRAVLASRPGKQHGIDPEMLRAEWRGRAREAGFDPDRLGTGVSRLHGLDAVDREAIVADALARVTDQGSVWLRADLAREIAAFIPAGAVADPDGLIEMIDGLAAEAAGRCVELHPPAPAGVPARGDGRPVSEHATDRCLSTAGVLAQEERLLDWAITRLEPAPAADGGDRQRAVAHAIGGMGRLVLVVGPAGAGKTTAIRAGVDALRAQGRPVLGLAPSGKAADVLGDTAGCPATTLATVLYRDRTGQDLPAAGTTVVLDEAGMAATDDLATLVTLTERHGWRLICVGDPEQLPAVGRGGMFAHWCDTLPAHRLEEIHRFTEPWQAQASLALRRGDPVAAAAYAQRGRVATVHPALLARQVARQYLGATARGEPVAITTATAGTGRAINSEIQYHRHVGQPRGPAVELVDGTQVRVGDRIATRRNQATLITDFGAAVRNRHTWDVTAIDTDGSLTAQHPDRGTVTLPAGYVTRHVELGWAVTGYGTQGITTDHGICIIEPSSSRAGIYVGLTRGRNHNTAWILDPTGLAEPEAALATAIARPPNATTALATRGRLHRAQGLEPPSQEPVAPAQATPLPNRPEPPSVVDGRADPLDERVEMMRRRLDALQHRPPPSRSLGR
ncbi:hypothetical protein BH20ACT2_BH20ACT2_19970 [soil metagenome]